jgi:preprotein translocase subunit YajC
MFPFLLDETSATGNAGATNPLFTIGMIVAFALIFYFLIIRPSKKQQKEEAAMRNALEVGDEITTIGGIIGEIVSMKEDTITIETSKAGTKIRFLKSAVRSVDVRAADKNAPQQSDDSANK